MFILAPLVSSIVPVAQKYLIKESNIESLKRRGKKRQVIGKE